MGASSRQLDHLVRSGMLGWSTPRVLRLGGAPPTDLQCLLEAVLDSGLRAALSHTTVLAHWGVRGFITDPVHVTRHRDDSDHPGRGTVLHEVRFLPRARVRTLEGVPAVSPALGLLQVAGMRSVSDARLERAIDAAWSDRLVSYTTLVAIDRLMARQGRRGLTRFRAMVDERGPAYVPPASNLESRFAQLLESAGRPPMRRQVDLADETGWIGRVDFVDDVLPVVVEIQSERFHRGLVPEADDRRRQQRLEASGRVVVEVTDIDLFHRPDTVIAQIDAARQTRAA
jgi:hypothetical protein